jgi:type IV secretion system protein VirB10
LYNVDRVARSEGLEQLPADYSQLPPPSAPAVPQLGPPLPGDLGGPFLRAEQQVQGYDYRHTGPDPAEAERLARLKEAEEAALSSVFFRSGGGRTTSAGTPTESPPGHSKLAGFDPMAAGPASTAAVPANAGSTQNSQEQKEAFLSKSVSPQIRNSGFVQMPDSPYQVMAGTVIAAALVTGIKSDLPGDVIATVTEPVYDSATGQHVLIPQGSRLLGRYNSQVSYGQSRVQVVWQRVILPDTSSFQLDNLVGSDTAGYAGLEDGVDWHWDRIAAGAVLTSLLGIGAELAAPANRTDGDRIIIAGRDSLQDTVNQVGQEVTRRNLDIQPTLTQRPGLPLRVIVNRDLPLRPYQPLFIQRRNH